MKTNPIGFHTHLTPEVHEKILYAVNSGLSNEDIAALADVHPATLRNWLDRGNIESLAEECSPFAHLFKDFIKEKALYKKTKVELLKDNSTDIKWLLERRFPESFSENSKEIQELIQFVKEMKERGVIHHGNLEDQHTQKTS